MKIPITATMARLDLRDELHEQVQKTIQQEWRVWFLSTTNSIIRMNWSLKPQTALTTIYFNLQRTKWHAIDRRNEVQFHLVRSETMVILMRENWCNRLQAAGN
jgi:hypothetical protein